MLQWNCYLCFAGFFLFVIMESSLLHHQLYHSHRSFFCWDTQTSCGTINVSFVAVKSVICFVNMALNIQFLPLIHFWNIAHFPFRLGVYFFDLCLFSIAARCRTVLAEYNMSCDDVSVQISVTQGINNVILLCSTPFYNLLWFKKKIQ